VTRTGNGDPGPAYQGLGHGARRAPAPPREKSARDLGARSQRALGSGPCARARGSSPCSGASACRAFSRSTRASRASSSLSAGPATGRTCASEAGSRSSPTATRTCASRGAGSWRAGRGPASFPGSDMSGGGDGRGPPPRSSRPRNGGPGRRDDGSRSTRAAPDLRSAALADRARSRARGMDGPRGCRYRSAGHPSRRAGSLRGRALQKLDRPMLQGARP